METIHQKEAQTLTRNPAGPTAGNPNGSHCLSELLPEPMAETTDSLLEQVQATNLGYFAVMVGIIIFTIGLGILTIGFATLATGVVLTASGSGLMIIPAVFSKLSGKLRSCRAPGRSSAGGGTGSRSNNVN